MPHKPLQTYDRKMKRFVTASESKAVTAEGISNSIGVRSLRQVMEDIITTLLMLEKQLKHQKNLLEEDRRMKYILKTLIFKGSFSVRSSI